VTTEEDFQAALDANPDDHHTRLVFADWLQERDDVRAEGYRALGLHRRYPDRISVGRKKNVWWWSELEAGVVLAEAQNWRLPKDWCERLEIRGPRPPYYPLAAVENANTRREVEDVAAVAFAQLPAERRTELLTPLAGVGGKGKARKKPRGERR
jgi:uncharacterized protein (TIGR02996 family)